MKIFLTTLLTLGCVMAARAQLHTESVVYKDGDTTLEGFSAYDDSIIKGKRPGVLIVHQWKGLGDYEKKRAEMLAKLGYVAFAADIYGKGIRPQDPKKRGRPGRQTNRPRPVARARQRWPGRAAQSSAHRSTKRTRRSVIVLAAQRSLNWRAVRI